MSSKVPDLDSFKNLHALDEFSAISLFSQSFILSQHHAQNYSHSIKTGKNVFPFPSITL